MYHIAIIHTSLPVLEVCSDPVRGAASHLKIVRGIFFLKDQEDPDSALPISFLCPKTTTIPTECTMYFSDTEDIPQKDSLTAVYGTITIKKVENQMKFFIRAQQLYQFVPNYIYLM